jgi:hypothetical protein
MVTTPRFVLAPKDVEDCFYIALEAGRIARKYSCPVIILSDQALSSRIEAFEEPDLDKHWVEPTLDQTPRDADWKPYPLDKTTQHAPPGTKMAGGKYPHISGLEHDEWGHPSGNAKMHQQMTNKRRKSCSMPPLNSPRLEVMATPVVMRSSSPGAVPGAPPRKPATASAAKVTRSAPRTSAICTRCPTGSKACSRTSNKSSVSR